jgi:hypothetical protein
MTNDPAQEYVVFRLRPGAADIREPWHKEITVQDLVPQNINPDTHPGLELFDVTAKRPINNWTDAGFIHPGHTYELRDVGPSANEILMAKWQPLRDRGVYPWVIILDPQGDVGSQINADLSGAGMTCTSYERTAGKTEPDTMFAAYEQFMGRMADQLKAENMPVAVICRDQEIGDLRRYEGPLQGRVSYFPWLEQLQDLPAEKYAAKVGEMLEAMTRAL